MNRIFMNEYYNEPEISVNGDLNDLDALAEKQYNTINPKYDWELNEKLESDYHNTYYNTSTKKYGTRTIRMNNKEWHKLNKIK